MSRVSVQKNPKVEGSVAHDAADVDSPLKIGGKALTGEPSAVANNDRVNAWFNEYGALAIFKVGKSASTADEDHIRPNLDAVLTTNLDGFASSGALYLIGPDDKFDRWGSAGDSGPGFRAGLVAPIGGDITLRASAIAGEAGGTSTAVDNLGWVKSFNCHLDVTAAPSGGAPTLNVWIQTQLASGEWHDIVSFTQASGVTAEIVDYGPPDGNLSGIGAEGAAVTYDRFFAKQDGALTAANIRLMNLGDSMRIKWAFAAGGSTGDFTFAVTGTFHS